MCRRDRIDVRTGEVVYERVGANTLKNDSQEDNRRRHGKTRGPPAAVADSDADGEAEANKMGASIHQERPPRLSRRSSGEYDRCRCGHDAHHHQARTIPSQARRAPPVAACSHGSRGRRLIPLKLCRRTGALHTWTLTLSREASQQEDTNANEQKSPDHKKVADRRRSRSASRADTAASDWTEASIKPKLPRTRSTPHQPVQHPTELSGQSRPPSRTTDPSLHHRLGHREPSHTSSPILHHKQWPAYGGKPPGRERISHLRAWLRLDRRNPP